MSKKQDLKSKKIGQFFTPQYLVEEMLDYAGYYGPSIIEKHVIDNSCGDGAFLKIIVERYCEESFKAGRVSEDIKKDLESFIHGIDNDETVYKQCLSGLDEIANRYGIEGIKWDIHNKNALAMNDFDGKMDFVFANPPYVRVHNLDASYNEVKQYKFANGGMTDLYLAFFELGFKMLSPTGKMCYITPSSWLNSVAAHNMRLYILKEQNLVSLTDLGHFQPFEKATAYTIISLFANDKKEKKFDYYKFNGEKRCREFCDSLSLDDCYIDSYLYLSKKKDLVLLKDIKTSRTLNYVSVKNGFATLADNVFIGEDVPQTRITIKILKASTGKWSYCLFPYDKKGKLLPPEVVFSDPLIVEHFEKHKDALLKGREEYNTYYEFGRTQALADVWKEKIAINTLIRSEKDLKIEKVNSGAGLYSGLYIINELNIPFEDIKRILACKEFIMYVSLLKKYKSGGYYTFNSKDVQQYINYYITNKSDKKYVEQQDFFGENSRIF